MRARLSGGIDIGALRRGVRLATAAYLGLPLLLFAGGWLRAPAAAVFAAAVAVTVMAIGRTGDRRTELPDAEPATVRLAPLAVALAIAAVPVLLSGAGGFGPRNWDWLKHDAVLKDLVAQPWPVRYATDAGSTALVYYIAYYLPAALVGKLAGWTAANVAIAATSLVGAALAVLWLVVLSRASPLVCGLLFAFFSGMHAPGALITGWPGPRSAGLLSELHLETWAGLWQYSGNASLLCFVPHQAIAGWLLTALAVDSARPEHGSPAVVALAAVSLLWSPLVTIGLLPLLIAALAARGGRLRAVARSQASWASAVGLLVAALLAAYFAARLWPLALPERFHPARDPAARGAFWFVPLHEPLGGFLLRYGVFVVCEFALLWLLLLRSPREDPATSRQRPFLWAAGLTLLTLPWLHYGLYNDLVMRASIPALFVLQVGAAVALRGRSRTALRVAVAGVLAVGALGSANLLRMQAQTAVWSRCLVRVPPYASVRSLFHLQLHDPAAMGKEFVAQYLGATDSPFFECLARRSEACDVAPDRQGRGAPAAAAAPRARRDRS